MRIALVLGAGATLAQARYLRAKGASGELPPLDATFFETLIDLGTKVPPSLRSYAIDVLGVDPFAREVETPRMEESLRTSSTTSSRRPGRTASTQSSTVGLS